VRFTYASDAGSIRILLDEHRGPVFANGKINDERAYDRAANLHA
jgi:hypothetical protein